MIQRNLDHWPDHVHGHDRHHGDHNKHEHHVHHGGDGDVVPMTISFHTCESSRQQDRAGRHAGNGRHSYGTGNMWAGSETVHAIMDVHARGLNARSRIDMTFEAPAESNRTDWAEIVCERALTMFDPA